jgi:hypothetical protein
MQRTPVKIRNGVVLDDADAPVAHFLTYPSFWRSAREI